MRTDGTQDAGRARLLVAAIVLGALLFVALTLFLFYFVVQMTNPSIPPIPIAQKARVDFEPQVIEAEAVKRIEIDCARATVTMQRGKSTQPLATVRIEETHRDDDHDRLPYNIKLQHDKQHDAPENIKKLKTDVALPVPSVDQHEQYAAELKEHKCCRKSIVI